MSADASLKADGAGVAPLAAKTSHKFKGGRTAHTLGAAGQTNAFSGLLRELGQETGEAKRAFAQPRDPEGNRAARAEDRRRPEVKKELREEPEPTAGSAAAPMPTAALWRSVWASPHAPQHDATSHASEDAEQPDAGQRQHGAELAKHVALRIPDVEMRAHVSAERVAVRASASVDPVAADAPIVATSPMPDDASFPEILSRDLPVDAVEAPQKPMRVAVLASERHLPPATGGQPSPERRQETPLAPPALADDAAPPAQLEPQADAAPLRAESADRPAPAGKPALDRVQAVGEARGGDTPAAAQPSAGSPPPAQQIATAITRDLASGEPAAVPRASLVSVSVEGREPVRLLRIALAPEQLGGLTVQLRQTATGVQIVVAAERPETSLLLEQDRRLLHRALDAAGLKVDEISIRHAVPDASPAVPPQQDNSAGQSAGQNAGSPPFGGAGGASGGERQQANRPGRFAQRQESEKDETAVPDHRGDRGALYV